MSYYSAKLFFCAFLTWYSLFSQVCAQGGRSQPNPNAVPLNLGKEFPIFITDLQGRQFNSEGFAGVEGSPFLYNDWITGNVFFENNFVVKKIPLKLDIYSNKLYFKKEEQVLEFVQKVIQFQFKVSDGHGDSILILFRNGYPSVNSNDTATFYKVLLYGKFQLLSFIKAEIEDVTAYNKPVLKRFERREKFYACFPENGTLVMHPVKLKAKDRIEKYILSNKIDLMDDAQVSRLANMIKE